MVIHTFYWFQGPSILTCGTLFHRLHMFQRFHLFLASLVMARKNIRLERFGRGNINDIETKILNNFLASMFRIMTYLTSPVMPSWRECQAETCTSSCPAKPEGCHAGNANKLEESQTRACDNQSQEVQQSTTNDVRGSIILNYRDARMPTDQLPQCQMTAEPDPGANARGQC